MKAPQVEGGAPPAPSLEALGLLSTGRVQLLVEVNEAFREYERMAFGDTIRYRMLELLLREDGPFTLVDIARRLGLGRSATKAYPSRGQQMGPVRREVERLARQGVVLMRYRNRRFECSINRGSLVVQWVLAVRSLDGARGGPPPCRP